MNASPRSSPGEALPFRAWSVAGAALALAAGAASGQVPERATAEPAEAIRVVQIYDATTRDRDYTTVRGLHPGEVAAIQAALGRVGFPTGLTGRLDAPTRDALRRFQRLRDLEPCGCPSYETVAGLGLATRTTQIRVRSGAEEAGGREEAETAAIDVVYGRAPRRPAAPTADGPPAGEEAGPAGPDGSTAPRVPSRATVPTFGHHAQHLLFPVLVAPNGLFPPPPLSSPTRAEARGRPIGQPRTGRSSPAISTRRPPSGERGGTSPPP